MLVCDSMVVIHLAKTDLLRSASQHFGGLSIPSGVYDEVVVVGKNKGFPDAFIVESLVQDKSIDVFQVKDKKRLDALTQFGVRGGEAEAVALALQKKCMLACDDDAVRSRKNVLGISLVSTVAILVMLVRSKKVPNEKIVSAVGILRKVGWFSSTVLDQVLLEVEKNAV